MPEFTDSVTPKGGSSFEVIVHPCPTARAIIINVPGFKGNVDGFNNKYRKIGRMLTERGVGAYVQMPNNVHLYKNREWLIRDVRATIYYALKERDICADPPEIYLSGTSIGAVAVAAAANYPAVKKILMIAPAYTDQRSIINRIQYGLSQFSGELYIAIGDRDEFYGNKNHERYAHIARSASKKEIAVIPNCDHYFTGKRNGMILSKAPLWAFAKDTSFPSPEGGIVLYE